LITRTLHLQNTTRTMKLSTIFWVVTILARDSTFVRGRKPIRNRCAALVSNEVLAGKIDKQECKSNVACKVFKNRNKKKVCRDNRDDPFLACVTACNNSLDSCCKTECQCNSLDANEQGCTQARNCAFDNKEKKCNLEQPVECSNLTKRECQLSRNEGCVWERGNKRCSQAVTGCAVFIGNKVDCIADQSCDYIGGEKELCTQKVTGCAVFNGNAQGCNADVGYCFYDDCSEDCDSNCESISNSGACKKLRQQCKWKKSTGCLTK